MYKRQVNVLRTKSGVFQQPTKGDLAVYAAREMRRYIVSVWSTSRSYLLRFRQIDAVGHFKALLKKSNITFPYDMDQLVLLYIVRTSKGSVQAHIGPVEG